MKISVFTVFIISTDFLDVCEVTYVIWRVLIASLKCALLTPLFFNMSL